VALWLLAQYAIAAAKQQGIKVIADANQQMRGRARLRADIVIERGPGFAKAIPPGAAPGRRRAARHGGRWGRVLWAIRDGASTFRFAAGDKAAGVESRSSR